METILIEKEQHEITPDPALMDAGEIRRYQQLLSQKKKLEFLTGRTFLKTTLSEYTGIPAKAISLSLTKNGKPFLDSAPASKSFYFNLTHSRNRYLVGIAHFPIGVDTEFIQPVLLVHYRHFLSPNEFQTLADMPTVIQTRMFYELFTLKEALLKATDKQLSLDKIEFELAGTKWYLKSPAQSYQFRQWKNAGYVSAICIQTGPLTLLPL